MNLLWSVLAHTKMAIAQISKPVFIFPSVKPSRYLRRIVLLRDNCRAITNFHQLTDVILRQPDAR
jgi:hypothetical protein